MYQDSLSAILLETNGKKLRMKKTKHIQVRYFFIKDQVATGDVELKHCPMTNILADHFTKPLQGEPFQRFRSELMNIPEDADITEIGPRWKKGFHGSCTMIWIPHSHRIMLGIM